MAEVAPEPVSLDGEWKQNISSDPENSWHAATVAGNTMEIYWVADADDTNSLYWAGTRGFRRAAMHSCSIP